MSLSKDDILFKTKSEKGILVKSNKNLLFLSNTNIND